MAGARNTSRHLARPRVGLLLIAALMLGSGGGASALVANKAFHQYVRNAWSLQEGLPQVSVNAIAQDGDGYLWVGTQTGLARFDGVRFVVFSPANTPQLTGAWIRSLFTDRDGVLWIGTYQGLVRHDASGFHAIPARDSQQYPTLDIFALTRSADGGVLAATSEGPFKVVGAALEPLTEHTGATHAVLERADGLWIGGTGHVLRMAHGVTTEWPLPAAAADVVTAFAEAQGQLWLGSSRGLWRWDNTGWQRVAVPAALASAQITVLLHDRDDNLWVGSDTGLARLRDAQVVEWVGADRPGAVKSPLCAIEDREGNLWLGSLSQGLLRFWSGWTRRYSESDGLHDPLVWSLSRAPDGRVWVGTNDGVSVFANGGFQRVVPGAALPNPQAYNLLAEADQVWIGTRRGAVLWRQQRIQRPLLLLPLAETQINAIVRDPDTHLLWFATGNGLFREQAGVLQPLLPDSGPADAAVRYLLRTRDGTWLAGGLGGLFRVRGSRLLAFGTETGLPPGLDITLIHELPDGELLVGALGEQTFVFDGSQWHALGAAQGLPGNVPFFVNEDDHGMLWLAGIRGISRVPLADLPRFAGGEIERVAGEMIVNERGDLRSGQQGLCCNGAGSSKGFVANGTLWLPSRDGIVTLDPHEVEKNPVPPPVVIEAIEAQQQWRDVGAAPLMRLPLLARDLQFAFTALSFQDPRSIRIEYRLRGYDADWQAVHDGDPRRVNYTNLPPGRYLFEVRAANNAGVWGSAPAQLGVDIPPLLRETAWFRALLVVVALAALALLLRWMQSRHDRQQARLQQLVDARTAELHALNLRLREASQTDPLTGLRNRRFLDLQMPADIGFYDRENPRIGSHEHILLFALIDVDAFKSVNDRFGHHAGDRVLQQLAHLLSGLLRSGDYIVRWGGEEFLLVFRPMPSQALSVLGERLRSEVAEHVFALPDGHNLRLTVSIGLSEYPLFRDAEHTLGWEAMVELADRALYWVKQHGRNGWAAFRPTASTQMATLLRQLADSVAAVLDAGALQLLSGSAPPPD